MERSREACAKSNSDNFQLKELHIVDKKFLDKKINNKDIQLDQGATENIAADVCSQGNMEILKQYTKVSD